jgi:hypothetical protein
LAQGNVSFFNKIFVYKLPPETWLFGQHFFYEDQWYRYPYFG